MVSFSPRTIFLMIRATSQIGEAFNDAGKKVDNLKEKQDNLAKTAQHLLFAGAAMVAFGAMVTGAMLSTLSSTLRGQRVLDDFGKAVERIKQSFSETIMNNFGEEIKGVLKTLTDFSNNKEQMEMIVNIALTFGPGLIAGGSALILSAVVLGITGILSTALASLGFLGAAGTVAAGGGAVVIGLITIGLAIGFVLFLSSIKFGGNQNLPEAIKAFAGKEAISGFTDYTGQSGTEQKPGEFGPLGTGSIYGENYGSFSNPSASTNIPKTQLEINNYIENLYTKADSETFQKWWDERYLDANKQLQTVVIP
jgi:hypothetical protein